MTSERKLHLSLALLLLAFVAAALFLLQRNVAVEDYRGRLQLMQEVGQLETKMDEDLQRVLSMQLLHYDPLVETVRQLNEKMELLLVLRGSLGEPRLDDAIDAYRVAVAQKIAQLEKIKSQVALLRNSLQYLPGLLDEFARSSATGQLDVAAGLLSALMEYNLFPAMRTTATCCSTSSSSSWCCGRMKSRSNSITCCCTSMVM